MLGVGEPVMTLRTCSSSLPAFGCLSSRLSIREFFSACSRSGLKLVLLEDGLLERLNQQSPNLQYTEVRFGSCRQPSSFEEELHHSEIEEIIRKSDRE